MIEFVWLTASLAQVIQAKIITSFHNFLLSIVWNWALRMSADVLIAATRWIKACWMSPLGLKAGVVSLPTLQTLWKAFAMIAGHLSKSSRALQSFVPVCWHLKKKARGTTMQPLLSLLYNTSLCFFFSPLRNWRGSRCKHLLDKTTAAEEPRSLRLSGSREQIYTCTLWHLQMTVLVVAE